VIEIPVAGLAHAAGWAAYLAGVMWAVEPAPNDRRGADVLVDSDVPQGSGLSSSAALECALALALADLAGADTDTDQGRWRLAEAAQRAEVSVVGAPVGIMDQAASLLGREGQALYLDTATFGFEHVPLRPGDHGHRLLVVDTGTPHAHSSGAYRERRRACEAAARAIGRTHLATTDLGQLEGAGLPDELRRAARHVITEEARTRAAVTALRRADFDDLGRLMVESHRSMQQDFGNSTPALDAVVAASLDAGASGARMTGGGWGGAAIVLVPTDRTQAVRAAVERTLRHASGAPDPVPLFEVRPSAGAQRVG
jgi:galactokinase